MNFGRKPSSELFASAKNIHPNELSIQINHFRSFFVYFVDY